jgi:hypothetical protein
VPSKIRQKEGFAKKIFSPFPAVKAYRMILLLAISMIMKKTALIFVQT